MLETIQLSNSVWTYDPDQRLGTGKFGTVFLGHSEEHGEIAVKKLHDTYPAEVYASKRELRIADELARKPYQNVIPLLDSGLDARTNRNYIVMVRAERSLDEVLKQGTLFDSLDAARILFELASGLEEVGDIVHRDLKPGNILLHEGRWKIADFGIARFIEESTSDETLQDFKSKPYAAPEQFNGERATAATDIYSLGCIGYALLTGKSPFHGPAEEYKSKHLNKMPDPIPHANPQLQQLLSGMLQKKQANRPSRQSVLKRLEGILSPPPSEPAVSLAVPVVTSQADLAEILARFHTQTELLQGSRAVQEQEKAEAEKVFLRLREPFNHIADAFRRTGLSEGRCDQIGSMSSLLFKSADARDKLWSKGYSVSASSAGAASATLQAGVFVRDPSRVDLQCLVQVDLRSGSVVRLVGGFVLKKRSSFVPIGPWEATASLGSVALDHTIANLFGHLSSQLPGALARFLKELSSGG
jgi:serine/threonine-protein kinase